MIDVDRPDLTPLDPAVVAYIEALEAEVARLQNKAEEQTDLMAPLSEPSEPPTTLNLITMSHENWAKRTPRHLYGRQHRAGMGIFDLEMEESDYPNALLVADENAAMLLFTDFGRAFRVPVNGLSDAPVRARGQSLNNLLSLRPNERVVAGLPEEGGAYVTMVSQRGWIRRVRSNYVGKNMVAGSTFHDVKQGGFLVGACWTPGDGEVFIATRQGRGLRFAENQIHVQGTLGLRVDTDDKVVAVTAVTSESGVLMITGDGKGTIRQMAGFAANKAPGAGGKVAIKTEELVGAHTVAENDDVFVISRLGKIIRFKAGEVPPKEGVVQGVNIMALRADSVSAFTTCKMD